MWAKHAVHITEVLLTTVTGKDEKMITFDANHEMAGKELNFKIELVEVK